MTHQFFKTSMRWILFVLVYVAITAGCAGFERQSKPAAVPDVERMN